MRNCGGGGGEGGEFIKILHKEYFDFFPFTKKGLEINNQKIMVEETS